MYKLTKPEKCAYTTRSCTQKHIKILALNSKAYEDREKERVFKDMELNKISVDHKQ